MVNTQQTSTTVATASGGMVLYEDSQERVVSMMCIYTFSNVHQVNTNARYLKSIRVFVLLYNTSMCQNLYSTLWAGGGGRS